MDFLARGLMVAGLVLLLLGLLLYALPSFPWLGRLPGDIRIERPGFRLYIPVVSGLLVSLFIYAVLWVISKFR